MKSCPTLNNTIIKGDHEKNKEYVLTAGSGTFDSSVFYMRSSSYYNNATYAIINNVYIQAAGSFGLENAMYIYPGFKPDESLHILTGSGRVIANLSDVISINNRWCKVFAHFLFDAVAPLAFIPENILKTSNIILFHPSIMYFQILEALGINSDQIIPLRICDFIFAQRLHIVFNPEIIHGNMIYGLNWIRQKISQRFNLSRIQPFYLGLYNRPKKSTRHILKFGDFISQCKKRYKNVYVIPCLHLSLEKCVLCYASIKILFGPTGSNLANMIYMKKECGIVCALADLCDLPMEACAEVLNMWMITFRVEYMLHHFLRNAPLNYTRAFIAIDSVIYAVENKKWKTKNITLYTESK